MNKHEPPVHDHGHQRPRQIWTELLTERLRLRTPDEGDVEFVQDMYSHYEVTHHIGSHDWVETTREQAMRRIERYRSTFGPASGALLYELRTESTPLGFTMMQHIPFSDHVEVAVQDTEIGWHQHPSAWGLGFHHRGSTGPGRPCPQCGAEKFGGRHPIREHCCASGGQAPLHDPLRHH